VDTSYSLEVLVIHKYTEITLNESSNATQQSQKRPLAPILRWVGKGVSFPQSPGDLNFLMIPLNLSIFSVPKFHFPSYTLLQILKDRVPSEYMDIALSDKHC
jgi:hypothetical protein